MAGPWEAYRVAKNDTQPGPWDAFKNESATAEPKEASLAQTALEGAGQGLTFGYLPQLQAAAKPMIYGALNKLTGRSGDDAIDPGDYVSSRDENIKRMKEQEEANPITAKASKLAGGLVSGLALPTSRLAEGAGLLAKSINAAKSGALYGAIQNPGDKQGEVSPIQAADRIENAGEGALIGGLVPIGVKGAKSGIGYLGKGAKKIASTASGVPEKEIETYFNRGDKVEGLIREFGDDSAGAADELRRKLTKDVMTKRQELGGSVITSLEDPKYAGKTFEVKPVLDKLKSKLDSLTGAQKTYKAEELGDLQEIIQKIESATDGGKPVSAKDFFHLKQYLQDSASSAYAKGGQIFSRGELAQRGAKEAAASVRSQLDEAIPELAKANKKLFELHLLEDNMNRNLMAPGKSEAALMAAGKGDNKRSVSQLKKLGELIDKDPLSDAENLAAARRFANPDILPIDSSAKSIGRAVLAGGAGTALGGPVGGLLGSAISSPTGVKYGVKLARPLGKILNAGADAADTQVGQTALTQALFRLRQKKEQENAK